MPEHQQRRNLKITYLPTKGVVGNTSTTDSTPSQAVDTPPRESQSTPRKVAALRKVRVRVKDPSKIVKVDVAEEGINFREDIFAQAEELLKYWECRFEECFKIPYDDGSPAKRQSQCDAIIESVGLEKAKRMVEILLTNPDFSWVNQKNLSWLANSRNRTRLAPYLFRTQKKQSREYQGERSPATTIRFRK